MTTPSHSQQPAKWIELNCRAGTGLSVLNGSSRWPEGGKKGKVVDAEIAEWSVWPSKGCRLTVGKTEWTVKPCSEAAARTLRHKLATDWLKAS